MRKFLSLLLALIMALTLTTTVAMADPGEYAGKLVILHSNDVHGAIEGYAYMAALKADYEAKGADVIVVDAGDYSQGNPNVSINQGANAIIMMNAVGYDVVTLGNHEFDYGYEQLKTNMGSFTGKVLCADVLDSSNNTIFDAKYVISKGGVNVGFFGLETPEAQTKANPALMKGLTFLAGEDLYQCAIDQANALSSADVVICLAHLGVDDESAPNRSTDLWNAIKGKAKVDMIIDGHSHTVMTATKDSPIQSTGTAFANIGVIVIDETSKQIEDNFLYKITDTSAKDLAVAGKAAELIAAVDLAYGTKFAESKVEMLGANKEARTAERNLGDLIADSMIWCVTQNPDTLKAGFDAKNVVAITNGGGIRADIKVGDVTKKDVKAVLPYGNTVALVYVKGDKLLEALEASTYCSPESVGAFPQVAGINFTIDGFKAYDANAETYPASTYYGPKTIQRVTINSINGQPFNPAAEYAVVTNNFCAAGGDTYYAFASAQEQFDTGLPLDEVLMDYITTELGRVIGDDYAAPQGRISYVTKTITLSNNGVEETKTIRNFSEIPTLTSNRYTFKGWYYGYIKVTADNFNELNLDGATLYAVWSDNSSSTSTTTTKTAVEAPKTADAGIVVYVGMSVMSLMGMGYMGKKKVR